LIIIKHNKRQNKGELRLRGFLRLMTRIIYRGTSTGGGNMLSHFTQQQYTPYLLFEM